MAQLYNVNPGWLRRRAEAGDVRFLRVGLYAYFIKGVDVAAGFEKLADPGTYLAWVEQGRPLERD